LHLAMRSFFFFSQFLFRAPTNVEVRTRNIVAEGDFVIVHGEDGFGASPELGAGNNSSVSATAFWSSTGMLSRTRLCRGKIVQEAGCPCLATIFDMSEHMVGFCFRCCLSASSFQDARVFLDGLAEGVAAWC